MVDISKIRKNTKLAIDNVENIIAKKRKQIEGIIDKEILKASDSKQYETTFRYGQLFADLFKKDEVKDFNDIKRYISDVIVPAYEKEGYSITLSSIDGYSPKYEGMTISWKETEKTEPIDLGTVELFTDEDGYKCKRRIEYWYNTKIRKCETVCKWFRDKDVPKYVIDFDVDGKAKYRTEYCIFLGEVSIDNKTIYDCDGNVAEVFQYVPNGKVLEHTKYRNDIKTIETHYNVWENGAEENSDEFGVVSCKILYDAEGHTKNTTEYEHGKKAKFKEFVYVPEEHYSRCVKETLFDCNGYVYAVKRYHLNGKVKSESEYCANSYRLRSYKEYDIFGRDTLGISYRDGIAVCKIEHIYEGCDRKYLIDTEYDSKGNWVKKTKLDSKGNIISVETPNTVDVKVLETETYKDGSTITFKIGSDGDRIGIVSMTNGVYK